MANYAVSETTKLALCDALKHYMALKPLDRISIRELTEYCGVKRQTFYYHFVDIYDLMSWMFQREAVSLLARHEGILFWQEGLVQLFQYLSENRAVCLCALHSMGREHLKRLFQTDIHALLHQVIEDLTAQMDLPDRQQTQDLTTQLCVVALVGVIEEWLLGEIDCTPEVLVDYLDRLVEDVLRGCAARIADTHPPEG